MTTQTLTFSDPDALVQTDWLAAHLDDSRLRIFDCTTHLRPAQAGTNAAYQIVSGRADYDAAHIPGAGFLDLQGELSDNTVKLRFMLPGAEDFAAAMSRHGVGDDSRVVLYSSGAMMWATRVWWMLREFGFTNAAVLDGGWEKWRAEGRPVSAAPCSYRPAVFTPRQARGLFVSKERVRAAIDDPRTVTINALPAELHRGRHGSPYGRPGRIPGSVNIPYAGLIDRQTKALAPLGESAAKFEAAGAEKSKNVICYCGGGIAASLDLFVLHQLGYRNLGLYDASMSEWARDESLPIETD
ncbi:MAG TPA: sulfurtransferase [Candidatus Binataceae bacterium]|nr:sulfurtransferase [Candidatus Binataceae bacterium]